MQADLSAFHELREQLSADFPKLRIQLIDSLMVEPFLQLHKTSLIGLLVRPDTSKFTDSDKPVLIKSVVPSRMLSVIPGAGLFGMVARKKFALEMKQWLEKQGYTVDLRG